MSEFDRVLCLTSTLSSSQVIYDRETGRSRGFAFVTFATQAEANKAIEELDGTVSQQAILWLAMLRASLFKPLKSMCHKVALYFAPTGVFLPAPGLCLLLFAPYSESLLR
jgi:hypothetical protein